MNSLVKKSIGTLAFLGVIVGAVAISVPTDARAQFINTVFGLVADGVVLDIDSDSITIGTAGTDPIVMAITSRTRIIRGPIEDGDTVKVTARVRGGEIQARIIKKTGMGPGYGFEGDRVIVSKAKVIDKGPDYFVVQSSATNIAFSLTSKTRFFRGNFPSLEEGDWVKVIGEDGGDIFLARYVFIQQHGKKKYGYGYEKDDDEEMEEMEEDEEEYGGENYEAEDDDGGDYVGRPQSPRAPRAPRQPRNR